MLQKNHFKYASTTTAVALALSSLSPAVLADTTWTGDAYHLAVDPNGNAYRVNEDNAWERNGNWSKGAPASNEVVNVDRPLSRGTNDVAQLDSAQMIGSLNVGTSSNGLGQLNVGGNGWLEIADALTLGSVQGAVGKASFNNGARLGTAGDLIVGKSGSGELNLGSGSRAHTQGNALISAEQGASGALNVDGGATLTSDKTLTVGGAGNGSLTVGNGAQVNARDSIVAAAPGATSAINISGAGSQLNVSGNMTLGQSGKAALTLADQGQARVGSGALQIARDASASAALYVGAASANAADARAAGQLDATRVIFGLGQGLVQFNHSDSDHSFDAGFEGHGRISHIAGQTLFNGDSSTFSGELHVQGGELLLNNAMAGQVQVDRNASLHIGAHNGSAGAVLSDIGNDGQVVFDRNNSYQYDQVISGSGSVEQRGTGTTVLTAENTYSGGTLISNGTLQLGAGTSGGRSGSILGDVQIDAPGSLVLNRADSYRFGGSMAGSGTLNKRGTGRTELSGNSSNFHGQSQVEAGILAVNGTLGGSTDVHAGATLAGNGQVGNVTLHDGATVAPGNDIGTLTVSGNLDQHSGSTFYTELLSTGANDRLQVNGAARLDAGSIVNADKLDSARYELDRRYLILATQQGLSGRYNLTGDTRVSTFYNLVDNYDSHNAYLDVQQTRLFQDAALSRNQRATATALQSLKGSAVPALTPPVHNKLFEAIAYLPDDHQARAAFEQLSGDFHSSTRSALIQDSRLVRDAANSRLRSVTATQDSGASRDSDSGLTPWITTLGNWGEIKGDSNVARLRSDTQGVLAGVDTQVGDSGHIGALTGYSRTELKSSSRDASSDNDNIHLGVYGGAQVSNFDLRGGLAYTWSRIDAKRSVNFAGYSDHLQSTHQADTLQAFGEVGRRLDFGPSVQLEPFANLTHVQVKSDGFKEHGGLAALSAKQVSDQQTFATLGLRASASKPLDSGKSLSLFASAGWKHALAGVTPANTYRFDASDAFRVEGVAYSRNSAVLEAGVETRLTPELSLGAAYSAQLGDASSEHGLRLNASYQF
ncbi:outer membrane autotransporter barrel domain-containing protein [Pseudomonas sp. NFPP10]|uniref:autotransporter outer membrane beta-barrel domain-containing protein n=1 Tax=unclassified Pseudomonas TaxID=196821 RepID=UPI0008848103|nr:MULTISPECIES: autotransporter domain-containing protein [unclassified Pseudomonas]SDA21054.1 outer membrane autotransporter barrel domain-containing protein [Pseudomonas sp. NFPP12]SEL32872.1 outer membrane autotransporter barrel domain-containing protein [Pseudomonas sp. NFPP10]SFI95018.1 outer membrane autotransporter barrel domain-containing protein [Pseudomonas sp. NFPP08]SFM62866.1 outer membrane autotransporter barrel domain-containing protein [Pseudomonas sp. NFPP05]SFX45327.1 outer 